MFRVSGTIEEEETGRPLADLIVRAFDRDLISDDRLGFATTDAEFKKIEREFRDYCRANPGTCDS